MSSQPAFTMVAGPNGSGKSELVQQLLNGRHRVHVDELGVLVNADELLKELVHGIDFERYGLQATQAELQTYFSHCTRLLDKCVAIPRVMITAGRLHLQQTALNAYHAAALADWLCQAFICHGVSFCLETVMSAPQKVDLLKEARAAGFETRLVWVATDDPRTNVERVALRVKRGGHHVDETKTVERYRRSMKLLPAALKCAKVAFLFDNSRRSTTQEHQQGFLMPLVATWNDSALTLLKEPPLWLNMVLLQKMTPTNVERTIWAFE